MARMLGNSLLPFMLLEPMFNNSNTMQCIAASRKHMSQKKGGRHHRTWAEREPLHEMHARASANYDSHLRIVHIA